MNAVPAQALLLAAGRGERMRPLTDHCPKPLLRLRGKPLMQWAMESMARDGITQLLINTAWQEPQIADYCGPMLALPGQPPLHLRYSCEGADFGGALETAGGIARALPALDEVFWLAAGDVYAPDFEFSSAARECFAASGCLAHLWLVANPDHHPHGDFGLSAEGLALNHAPQQYTYSTLGLFRRSFFADLPWGNPEGVKAPLAPLLRAAMAHGQVSASIYPGRWTDVGTPARLAELNEAIASSP